MLRPAVWIALVVSLGACSGGGSSDDDTAELTNEQAKLGYCADKCERIEQCLINDALSCQQSCVDDWNASGIRSEVLVQAGECAKALECATFSEDDPIAACFVAASEALPLTDTVLTYCENISANDFRCNVWVDVEQCTKNVASWRDEVLSDVQSTCLGVACPKLEACYVTTFDKYR